MRTIPLFLILSIVLVGCTVEVEEIEPEPNSQVGTLEENSANSPEELEEVPATPPEAEAEYEWGKPALHIFNGFGDDTIELDEPILGTFMLEISSDNPGSLMVSNWDRDGAGRVVFDNSYGRCLEGPAKVSSLGFLPSGRVDGFDVFSDSDWRLRVKSLGDARTVQAGNSYSGSGFEVLRFLNHTQSETLVKVEAGENAKVFSLGVVGDLNDYLIDTDAPVAQQVEIPVGTLLLIVGSCGGWTLDVP